MAVALLVMCASGCAARMEKATVSQAAHDLRCSEEHISIEKVAFAEYRAKGCGQIMSYQVVGECFFDWNPCHAAPLAPVEHAPPELEHKDAVSR